jgi:hypothetical protein
MRVFVMRRKSIKTFRRVFGKLFGKIANNTTERRSQIEELRPLNCQNYCKNFTFQKFFLHLLKSISSRKNLKPLNSRGSILVEFALGAPVLIAIMLCGHDIFKMAKMRERMEFCAHCAANMFQNISQERTNKLVTQKDFAYISCAAFLPFWGGGTQQYESSNGYVLGVFGEMTLLCVVGTAPNKAKIKWAMVANWGEPPPSRVVRIDTSESGLAHVSIINKRCVIDTVYDANVIFPDLQITEGEIKMIVDICLNDCGNSIDVCAKKLGFLVIKPKKTTTNGYFGTTVAFKPRPGLFTESIPPAQ